LQNIIHTPQVGLLFMVPGVDETLRVNGTAVLSVDAADLEGCEDVRRVPKLVIRVTVQASYLHCAKALMRSELWNPALHQPAHLHAQHGRDAA
jgi:predicted pyridoxine 5'-phosphate oxidase superfamily flavin-nucleotide-binding protein